MISPKKFKLNEKNFQVTKIPLKFDITILNMFIGYLFKKSVQITRKSLTNMHKLFNIIDESIYENNDMMEARIYFIKRCLDARLKNGFENENTILDYCRGSQLSDQIDSIISNLDVYKKLNYDEIKYINKAVEDRLSFYYLYNYKDRIYASIEKLDSGDYESFREINNELEGVCRAFIGETRKIKVLEDNNTFSLDDEEFINNVTDIYNRLTDPSRILKTGIQYLNKILAPGYMSKRLYMYMGLPGGFKSGILLKSLFDIKKYNKGIQVKKPGKRPCVLMVTMENTLDETLERAFNMFVSPTDIREYSLKDVLKSLKDSGEFTLADENDIDITIKYFPNRAIDTGDLYTIIEDLADDNKEVIALVVDYIKRIRPVEHGKDEKEELKNVTNELKNLAVDLDIPVISAHQLNRNAASTVDSAMTSNKEDLARFVGRSHAGSAWEVVENSDWMAVINIEKKKGTDQYYLTFKRVKIRYRDPEDLGYFNHPFELGNRIKLIDDIYLESALSEESLATEFEGIENKKGKRNAVERAIAGEGVDEDDIFDFSSSITKK